jgi:pimeloyl-ACP methyl ester carboxylesterase
LKNNHFIRFSLILSDKSPLPYNTASREFMPKSKTPPQTIVVLHGWTLDPAVTTKWQLMLALLREAGFTVKFWPLPGLTVASQKPLTLDDYISWLREKTRTLRPFILLGHSFGGQLAIRFARQYPDKVSRLILIDSSGLVDQSFVKVVKRLVFKFLAKTGKVITSSIEPRRWLYRLARETDYYRANEVQRQTMKNILSNEISGDLPQIKSPTLIIWGERDRITPLSFAKMLVKEIPGAKLKIIAGAKHSPVYTHAQAVNKLVKEFLAN